MDKVTKQVKHFDEVKFSPQEMLYVTTILGDCVNCLTILKQDLHINTNVTDKQYTPLRKRLGIGERNKIIHEETDFHSPEKSLSCLMDCAYLERVLQHTKKELETTCTFTYLAKAVIIDEQLKADLDYLENKLKTNKNETVNLSKQINVSLDTENIGIYAKNHTIANIKNIIHDELLDHRLCASYISRWEYTRRILNKWLLQNKEGEFTRRNQELQKSLSEEIQIHTEFTAAVDNMIMDLESNIIFWRSKYETDTEEKEQQILNIKMDRARNQRHFNALNELYMEHQREMEEFLAFKQAKFERMELERKLNKMATRIQAWWRGILCRKRLKAKKGKKGKKNKKGKKGKKKQKGKASKKGTKKKGKK